MPVVMLQLDNSHEQSYYKDTMTQHSQTEEEVNSFIHSRISFIHSRIYIAPLQGKYSEVLPTPARSKRTVLN